METKDDNLKKTGSTEAHKDIFPGNLIYPASEDIYNKNHKEADIDPEDISKKKEHTAYGNRNLSNEKDFEDDKSGSDLDVPGSELDDAQENIGSEDEENNNYSIGGENHNDLEEDNG